MGLTAAAANPRESSRRNGRSGTGAANTQAPSRTPSRPRRLSRSSLDSRPMAILGAKTYQNYIDGQWVDAASGQTTPSELPDKFQMSVRMPVGVVGAITPWNFPIAIPSWKTLPAIVCGNTVVFKPATDTPALGERYVELFAEAGLPNGVLNIVHGGGSEVGQRLVEHPDVPIITFTGSRATGVAVTKAAAENLKHVHLELGGQNAIIVMDDADLDLAVDGIVWSAFGTSGQRCTAASRGIVHEAVYDQPASRLVARVEQLRLGPGGEDETDVGPVINRSALEKIHSYTGIGRDAGPKLLTGGGVASADGLDDALY